MNPYEKTAQEMQRQSQGPKRFTQAATGIGTAIAGAGSFASILTRAAPLLSQYIPEELSIKGLSKLSPKFGNFIKEALNGGYDFQEIKDFIGSQIKDSQSKQDTDSAQDNRNVIEKYSPELHQFVSQKIKSGEDPIRAAALALFEKGNNFEPIIRKIEKDHKINWSQLVQSIYGGQVENQPQKPQQAPQQQAQPQAQTGQQFDPLFQALQAGDAAQVSQLAGVPQNQAENLIMKFNQSQGGQQQQSQGQGAQALQAILQKINQRLGG